MSFGNPTYLAMQAAHDHAASPPAIETPADEPALTTKPDPLALRIQALEAIVAHQQLAFAELSLAFVSLKARLFPSPTKLRLVARADPPDVA